MSNNQWKFLDMARIRKMWLMSRKTIVKRTRIGRNSGSTKGFCVFGCVCCRTQEIKGKLKWWKNSYKEDLSKEKLWDDTKSILDIAAKISTLEEYQWGLSKIKYSKKNKK